jgi:uracil-DNA glycosylase
MSVVFQDAYEDLRNQVSSCTLCAHVLPHAPRPVMRGFPSAKILIISQAPGLKVHQTGLSFNDASGNRLRDWMGIDRDTFYDEHKIGIIPMGLCFPGYDKNGGDLPPIKSCAPFWHPRIRPFFPETTLILLVGGYSQKYYLGDRYKGSLTETVQDYKDYLPDFFPLPHPSWRNTGWIKAHPWFENIMLPHLKDLVQENI